MTPSGLPALTDPRMRPGAALLAEGRALARLWPLGTSRFMREAGVRSEAEYKRQAMAAGRMMQHAHIGFRSVDRTVAAIAEVHEKAAQAGVRVDRFGITLDWTMGYPPDRRDAALRGTGIVLTGAEDFARITNASPAASHFGDFMLGLPGAVANATAAIAAGATSIGNLGQYFTFRLPYWDDDVSTTEATVTALGLLAAQPVEILVHSNLDDGFAGLFQDIACALGMVLIEKHIVEGMIGARLSVCYGHHFSEPLMRAAFHAALAQVSDTPGTMIFGNTVAYRSEAAGNYASLSSYLLADMLALGRRHTGHAINPVPVTENLRIPDVDEILDAQCFAARLAEHAPGYAALVDPAPIAGMAATLLEGGRRFAHQVLDGLAGLGVDADDPAALLLAIRRMGPKRLEAMWGPGTLRSGRRVPLAAAEWAAELDHMATAWAASVQGRGGLVPGGVPARPLRIAIGTTDVHEHGKYLVETALAALGVTMIDAGVAVDAEALVACAVAAGADAIAVSTYNGVALGYARAVLDAMRERGITLPLLIGGKLNQVPQDTNSGLPVDVTDEIRAAGAHPCTGLDDMLPVLRRCAARQDSVSL